MMEEESGGMQLQAKGWHLAELRESSQIYSPSEPPERTNLASALFHTSTLQSQERKHICFVKPLSWWQFIATALGN